ncbi:MAG TPA: SPOR domain-containing protein [Gammaproteobacteria bacterium]|nr:SPOR domain-containing protein [Gammaproteobacteria bacterium]
MDIGIKERVIGAVVLVVIGIIVIPWVLQGPAPDTAVTRSLTLPAASTSAAPREYRMDLNTAAPAQPVIQSPATTPAAPPTASGREQAGPGVTQSIQRSNVEPQPDATASAKGGWMVQAGSYAGKSNALRLQKTLQARGYRVVISAHTSGGKTWYRVRVGPYASRTAAEKQLADIGRIYGGKPKVVPDS